MKNKKNKKVQVYRTKLIVYKKSNKYKNRNKNAN